MTTSQNSFMRFRAGLKVNLRQYIKSDFDLFWGPDVLWRSDFDVINRSSNFIRLLLNSPLESHWIRGLKLTSKLRAVQFWVSWKKWQQNQNVVRQFQAAQCEYRLCSTRSTNYSSVQVDYRSTSGRYFSLSFWSFCPNSRNFYQNSRVSSNQIRKAWKQSAYLEKQCLLMPKLKKGEKWD